MLIFDLCIKTPEWNDRNFLKNPEISQKKFLHLRDVEKLSHQQSVNAKKCNGNTFSEERMRFRDHVIKRHSSNSSPVHRRINGGSGR